MMQWVNDLSPRSRCALYVVVGFFAVPALLAAAIASLAACMWVADQVTGIPPLGFLIWVGFFGAFLGVMHCRSEFVTDA